MNAATCNYLLQVLGYIFAIISNLSKIGERKKGHLDQTNTSHFKEALSLTFTFSIKQRFDLCS